MLLSKENVEYNIKKNRLVVCNITKNNSTKEKGVEEVSMRTEGYDVYKDKRNSMKKAVIHAKRETWKDLDIY